MGVYLRADTVRIFDSSCAFTFWYNVQGALYIKLGILTNISENPSRYNTFSAVSNHIMHNTYRTNHITIMQHLGEYCL